MEKLNLVRRQCPCNKSTQENEKQNTYTSVVIPEAKTVFLEKGRSFFLYTVFLFNLIIWKSMCTAVYMSPHKFTMREENICLKVLVIEVQIATSSRFPATVGCFSCCLY